MTSGWDSVPLGDLCTVNAGGTPSRSRPDYWQGSIPWVKISDMLQGVIGSTEESISESGLHNSSAKILPRGTLLLSIFATIGRTAVLDIEAATNQAIVGLRIVDENRVDSGFLRRFLELKTRDFAAQARGVAQANINGQILKRTAVPLPPLLEQRRIAAMLDKADELRAKRRAALAHVDTLTQSVFLDMFGDPAANSHNWPEGPVLGDVADIVSGVTKGRVLAGRPTRSVPYLAVSNVQDRSLDLSTVKTIVATEDEITKYKLEKDDLLLTEGGDPDKLGRGTLWASELPLCIHQNHVFRVRLRSAELRPLFLNWLVGSSRGKRYFFKSAKQTTGIASINMTQLKAFPLLLPPVQLQRRFESRVEHVEAIRTRLQVAAVAVDSLFASIQHRAFRGEL